MEDTDPDFESLLRYLKESRGFDFTGYKRSSLMRRIRRRLSQAGFAEYAEYLDFLQVHPDEFTGLFNTILINVTSFFRDPDAWQNLQTQILPRVLEARPADAPIRVWSAGCASGEEAYTLAMVLAELLGPDEFRRRVKIYATDVDEEDLARARQAAYTEQDVAGVPEPLRDRYFEIAGDRYIFRKDLRRSVIFGRNDLVQDAPISRVDLLVCRNTLMYLNAETQARILARFSFALAPDGVLFLGKAEMLLSHSNLFVPIDIKRRVFGKVSAVPAHSGVLPPAPVGQPALADPPALDVLRSEAFLSSAVAQVVITDTGQVALVNRQAEMLFGLSGRDIGRPFHELELSYRPLELRGHVERAMTEAKSVRPGEVEYTRPGAGPVQLDIELTPLLDGASAVLGVSMTFSDVTDPRRLKEELEQANRQLESAYEELQSTNEELETTNEELQSTIEELETTNEELQSTNEELETMNEELQSTNDEVQTVNEQLRESTARLDAANGFLEAVLTSLRAGVAVIDRDLRVQAWNRRAEDQWGLRRDEVLGEHLLALDIGLPLEQLRPLIRYALTDGGVAREVNLAAVNRRGKSVTVRVACTPLTDTKGQVDGVVLLMETDNGDTIDPPDHD